MKNIKKILQQCFALFAILTLINSVALAQIPYPTIKWDKTYGGTASDKSWSIAYGVDGNILVGGESSSGLGADKSDTARGSSDYWVMLLDTDGNKLWDKTYGGSDDDVLLHVEAISDGYVLAGSSKSGIGGEKSQANQGDLDYWVIKIDLSGNIVWDKTFGGDDTDGGTGNNQFIKAKATSDNGFIVGGRSRSGATGDKSDTTRGAFDYWVLKLDVNGNKEWDATFGGTSNDYFIDIIQASNGDFVMGGWSTSGIGGDRTEASYGGSDYWVVKIDASGNMIWDKTFGSANPDYLYAISEDSNGNFILGGTSSGSISGHKTENTRGLTDYWVLKIDAAGNKIWDKTIGGDSWEWFHTLKMIENDQQLLVGISFSSASGERTEANRGHYDAWIVQLDSNGDLLWEKTVGTASNDQVYSIEPVEGGDFIIAVHTASNASWEKTEDSKGSWDYWVVKLENPLTPIEPVPTQPLNYVVSNIILKDSINENEINSLSKFHLQRNIQYIDGLGRNIQNVSVQASPGGYDVVQPIAYDSFGRQAVEYLPYVSDLKSGSHHEDAISTNNTYVDSEHHVFYTLNGQDIANSAAAYASRKFEPSPLNRVVEQGAPGEAWQPNPDDPKGKTIKLRYQINAAEQVWQWEIEGSSPDFPHTHGYYSSSELTLNVTEDEEGAETHEFVDKRGRTILKEVENLRDVNGVEWLRTYYVYDDFNNLRFVVPPKALELIDHGPFLLSDQQQQDIFDNLMFHYAYDERQRMIMKKVPGAEPVYMVYDQFDRLVFTQDGNQFGRSEWSFTKYDHLNRPVMTGFMTLTNSWGADRMAYRNGVEDALDTYYITKLAIDQNYRYESFSAADTWGYTDRSYPELTLGTNQILTVTYYDNYDFRVDAVLGVPAVNYQFEAELDLLNDDTFDKLKGQVTGSRTKVLGENKYLNTVTYYDDRYRVIQTITDNYTGGLDRVTSEYDFSGRVLRTVQTHSRGEGNFEDLVVNQSFTYDHASRLLNTYHRINSQDSVLLTANDYNEINELVEKNLYATDMANPVFKQSVDYRYNIRGWLTQINNSALSSPDANATSPDYFGMNLYYNEQVSGLSYGLVDSWQDPLNMPTQYFQQMLNGVSPKPIISYKNPNILSPTNTQNLNWDNKFGVDYRVINPKRIKAKISADKKPGMGFRYLKRSPLKTSRKAGQPTIVASNGEPDGESDPLTRFVTKEVFLKVDPATLTASLDAGLWIYEDFTKNTPSKNKPVTAAATLVEELWLEAECDTRGANWTMVNDGDASNNNYMVVASGTSQTSTAPASADDHLSFTFDIASGGNYKIWGRALTTSASDDSFWVRMDGGSWIKWNSIPSGSWQWDDVHDSDNSGTAVTFNLGVGSHTFDIALREVGAKIDKLYISDTGTTPTETGSAATNCVATAPPADPAGFVVDRTSYSYVEVMWDANTQIVDDYTLERSLDNTNFTAVATPAGNVLSFRDNTVQVGTNYYYRIRANNHLGSSNFTTSLNVSSLANPGAVTDQLLLYLDAMNAGSYPGSGAIWFDLSPNANDATLSNHSFDGTDMSFTYTGTQVITDEDIAIAQNQAFSVGFWINPSDNSKPTNVKSSNDYGAFNFSVRSGYPGSIEVGIGNTDATRIARTDLPAGLLANNQDQYFVYTYDNNIATLYKNGEFVYSKDIGAMTSAWVKFKLGYAVGKFNAAQVYGKVLTSDEISHNYFIGYGNTDTSVPATPTGLATTALSISQIALSWNDIATDEIYYLVERSTDGVNFSPAKYLPAGTTSYEDQGLNAGFNLYL